MKEGATHTRWWKVKQQKKYLASKFIVKKKLRLAELSGSGVM